MTQTNDSVIKSGAIGLGERLKSARIQKNIDISLVAKHLHLTESVVEAIERNDQAQLPTRVFVRGYIRNYARYLDMSEEQVLAEFDQQLSAQDDAHPALVKIPSVSDEVNSNHAVMRLMTWTLAMGIMGLFIAWWAGYLNLESAIMLAPDSNKSIIISSDSDVAIDSLLSQEDLSAIQGSGFQNKEDPDSSSPGRTADAVAGTVTQDVVTRTQGRVEAETMEPVTKAETETVQLSDVEAEAEAEAQTLETPPRIVDPVATPPVTAASLSVVQEPVQPVSKGIVFKFISACWVDIRDSQRKFKLFGEMPKGAVKTLGGVPPYKVIIGNAGAVEVSIDGQPFDVSAYAKGNVARFTLDPDRI